MRRSYAVLISLALFLTLPMLNPSSVTADPSGPSLVGYQQSTSYVIQRALAQRGVPFLYGGGNAAGPTRGTGLKANVVGFDASGLIQYAYAGAGLKMPRTSGEQCNVAAKFRPHRRAPATCSATAPVARKAWRCTSAMVR
jgi:cell wall-associated NlpC family hydrolase